MTQIEQLLATLRAYCEATSLAETTVSMRFLGRSSRAADLVKGGDMGSRNIEAAIRRFSCDWPEGAAWPEDVERPAAGSDEHSDSPTAPAPQYGEDE